MVCGGPGPILIYRLGDDSVRVIVDVPLGHSSRDLVAVMSDSYAGWMPEALRPAFVEALRARRFLAAANALRPRATYGSPRRVLIGDAAGHYHPLTAVGMTLGFGDALALAERAGLSRLHQEAAPGDPRSGTARHGAVRDLRGSSGRVRGAQAHRLPAFAGESLGPRPGPSVCSPVRTSRWRVWVSRAARWRRGRSSPRSRDPATSPPGAGPARPWAGSSSASGGSFAGSGSCAGRGTPAGGRTSGLGRPWLAGC